MNVGMGAAARGEGLGIRRGGGGEEGTMVDGGYETEREVKGGDEVGDEVLEGSDEGVLGEATGLNGLL